MDLERRHFKRKPDEVSTWPEGLEFKKMPKGFLIFSVENLPTSLKEVYPDGLVLKKIPIGIMYLPSMLGGEYRSAGEVESVKYDLREKLEREPSIDEIVQAFQKHMQNSGTDKIARYHVEDLNLPEGVELSDHIEHLLEIQKPKAIAKAFKNRQEEHATFFEDSLPDLVLKSVFVVKKDEEGREKAYELQRRIKDAVDVTSGHGLSFFKKCCDSEEYTREQIELIKKQLEVFLKKFNEILEEKRKILDLNEGNLLIDKEGKLLFVDTNIIFDAWKQHSKDGKGGAREDPSVSQINSKKYTNRIQSMIDFCTGYLEVK